MKKKVPRFRFLPFLMVLVLLFGIATPCYAESNVDTFINHDGNIYDTGTLVYNNDRIPPKMLDNLYLRALQYIGYDVEYLKEIKQLYNPEYLGKLMLDLEASTGHNILSDIPYEESGR